MSSNNIISVGDVAIAYSADHKRYHTFLLTTYVAVRLWKYSVKINGAIGHYYGSKFVIRGSNLELFDPEKLELRQEEEVTGEDKDNRNLLDSASNQKFSSEDIQELKESELAGEQLISEIVSGSNTFSKKSEFSKHKYITRKRAKHLPVIYIYRPSLRHLALMHYQLRPDKIGFLRIDTISLLMSLANVRHGSRLLVVDNFAGLIIGGVLERMGGGGELVELFTSEIVHPRPVLSSFSHLSPLHWGCLSAFPLRRLSKLREQPTNTDAIPTDNSTLDHVHASPNTDAIPADNDTTQIETSPQPEVELPFPKKDRYCTARELLLTGRFEGIILATKHNPVPILEACLPFISPSSPLLVYCVFPELIATCNEYFHSSCSIILKNLSSSWLRAYQPERHKLHPEMISSSCRTGYVLSGVRVKLYESTPSPAVVSETGVEKSDSPSSKRIKLL